MSLLVAGLLFSMLWLPLGNLSSPVKIWLVSWGSIWLANGIFGGVYITTVSVGVYVFIGVAVFVLGAIVGGAASPIVRIVDSGPPSPSWMEALKRGENFRRLANIGSLVGGTLALEVGVRQMGGRGVLPIILGGRDVIFESMRVGKASLTEGDAFSVPLGVTLATLALSCSAILIGLQLGVATPGMRRRSRVLSVTALGAYAFVMSVTTGVRSFLLVGALLLAFTWLAARVACSGGENVITGRVVSVLGGGVAVFFVWTVVVQSARLKDVGLQYVGETLEHLRPWVAGYLPALSGWYEDIPSDHPLTGGRLLARGVLTVLGLDGGEGVDTRIGFEEISSGVYSNAMTIFRLLWTDFGVAGGALACFVFGFTAQRVYRSAINRGGAWIVVLGCYYVAIFFSINYWFFAYGARVYGAFAALLVVHLSMRIGADRQSPSRNSRAHRGVERVQLLS